MRNLTLSLLLSLFTFSGYSQNIDDQKLDAYLDTLAAHNKFMGSVALAKNGELIYSKAVGYADIETAQLANTETAYRIGSISKTFTAALIVKASEKGKIDLNGTLDKYYPRILNAEKISITQLLSHRSGIHNITSDSLYLTYYTTPQSEEDMVKIIIDAGSDFEPGSKFSYSNSNYILLTFILEKAYGKPFSKIMEKEIIKPLKLKHTRYGGAIDMAQNEASSYSYLGKWKREDETDMSVPLGAGAVVSTPSDLVLFSTALFEAKIVSKESLNLMTTMIDDNYGLGLFEIPFDNDTAIGHTGGIDGFTSVFGYFPDQHLAYALTSNANNYSNSEIAEVLYMAAQGKDFDIPVFKIYDADPETFEQYVGTYSSPLIPIKVTITHEDGTLIAQATGQPKLPLEATAEHEFSFEQAGAVFSFSPDENQMTLKQRGANIVMTRE